MIKGVDHIGIAVADLDRSVRFYRDTIGMQVIAQAPLGGALYEAMLGLPGVTGRVATLERGGLQIELFEFYTPKSELGAAAPRLHDLGITHFCIRVEDIDAEYLRLSAEGVHFNAPPLGNETERATFGRDPDGNLFELLEIRG
jgi:catechol 2,3-dioxygenase-like lactoylglutathione lyase family enzyme